MALVEQSMLESLLQGLKERRTVLQTVRQMEQQMERQMEQQKELEQRWQKGQERQMPEASSEMVESCRLVAACGAVSCEVDLGESATLMGLRWKWCYHCYQRRSKHHSCHSSPMWSSRSQERIGIRSCRHRFR